MADFDDLFQGMHQVSADLEISGMGGVFGDNSERQEAEQHK